MGVVIGKPRLYFTQQPTEPSKQPIRIRYLGHVTGYQPIRDQYFPIWSIPGVYKTNYSPPVAYHIILGVPEDYTRVKHPWFQVGVYKGISVITPLIIWPDVRKVDEGVNRQRNSE